VEGEVDWHLHDESPRRNLSPLESQVQPSQTRRFLKLRPTKRAEELGFDQTEHNIRRTSQQRPLPQKMTNAKTQPPPDLSHKSKWRLVNPAALNKKDPGASVGVFRKAVAAPASLEREVLEEGAGTPKTPAGFLPGFDPSAVKLRSRRLALEERETEDAAVDDVQTSEDGGLEGSGGEDKVEGEGSSKIAYGDEAATVSAGEAVVESAAGLSSEAEDREEQKLVEASKQAMKRGEDHRQVPPQRPALAVSALGDTEAGTPKTPAGFLPGFDPSAVKLRSRRLAFTPEAKDVEDRGMGLESEEAVAPDSTGTGVGSEQDSETTSADESSATGFVFTGECSEEEDDQSSYASSGD
jgi:hypothetical protein